MSEKGNGIICRYDFIVNKTGRAKGATLLDTDKGYYLLREFKGTKKHLEFEEDLLNRLSENESIKVEQIVRDSDGNLINESDDGRKYVMHKWCASKDLEQKDTMLLIKAAGVLGKLHFLMNEMAYDMKYLNECFNIQESYRQLKSEFDKHNKEMKRTRTFIRDKRRKNEFELLILSSFDKFYQDGIEVEEQMHNERIHEFIDDSMRLGRIIHGAYNYHNIVVTGNRLMVTNFEHCKCGIQIRDLYDFMRKVMEKHSWNRDLGMKLLNEYRRNREITAEEFNYLILKFKYPEKYWKILNHYNNNNKAWIPDKDVIKLKSVIEHQDRRRDFINSLLNLK